MFYSMLKTIFILCQKIKTITIFTNNLQLQRTFETIHTILKKKTQGFNSNTVQLMLMFSSISYGKFAEKPQKQKQIKMNALFSTFELFCNKSVNIYISIKITICPKS